MWLGNVAIFKAHDNSFWLWFWAHGSLRTTEFSSTKIKQKLLMVSDFEAELEYCID